MLDVEVKLEIKIHHLEPSICTQDIIERQQLQKRIDIKAFKLKETIEKRIKEELKGVNK